MADEVTLPRWFIIVRRDMPVLYQHLRESYAGDGRVEVIGDRRATWEIPIEQAERRQTLAPSQQTFWVTEGIFMVRRALGASA